MIVLCAYYKGTVAAENRQAFDDYVARTHMPLVARYPGLAPLRYHKGVPWNGEVPAFYHAFELRFASREEFDRAMRSDIRRQAREDIGRFLPMFTGTVRHVLYDTQEIPVPA